MPVTVTYPGVYIEEIPSGVHTITGVATSIAAFVGWAPQGPTDSAQLVLSWPDYYRQYGGLDSRSLLGYAVSQFFGNGGTQAYIIRVVASDAATASTSPTVAAGTLTISAQSQGGWANSYGILIKNQSGGTNRFRLQIAYAPSGTPTPPPVVVESFENLSMTSPDIQGRYIADIVNAQSNFVTVAVTGTPTAPPADITTPQNLAGGKDGTVLTPGTSTGTFENAVLPGSGAGGVHFLEHVDLFNLLCVPGEGDPTTLSSLETFCRAHRAFLIADCAEADTLTTLQNGPSSSITGNDGINAAFYFPWINAPDPLNQGGTGPFPPGGFVAGIYAATDGSRGVWKAPAGTAASLTGVLGVSVPLNDPENGILNPVAVNCIRNFSVYGTVVWGARTLQGNDEIGSEWKYVPVRRTALYIEESLYRGTKWAVFEPNDEPLWSQLRLNVGAFMHDLFRKGAFQGQTPQDAYFVKCDSTTTTQSDINLGIVNIVVGFAPLKPAEFVVIQIQQMAGQIAT
ncbi:MAG: phage tail sheath family protein [Terriglobia bacterium]